MYGYKTAKQFCGFTIYSYICKIEYKIIRFVDEGIHTRFTQVRTAIQEVSCAVNHFQYIVSNSQYILLCNAYTSPSDSL